MTVILEPEHSGRALPLEVERAMQTSSQTLARQKREESAELLALTNAYLASGKTIQHIPAGVTAEPIAPPPPADAPRTRASVRKSISDRDWSTKTRKERLQAARAEGAKKRRKG